MRKGDGIILKGKSWYLEARINGVRYQKRLGKGITRAVAAELAAVVRGQILRDEIGIGGTKKKDLSFTEASKRFTDWMTSEKRPNTVRSYSGCLHVLAKTFGDMRLSQITPWALENYKQRRVSGVKLTEAERPADVSDAEWNRLKRQAQHGAPVRINRELGVMKMLFNRCRDWNLFEGPNPVCAVKFRREPRQRLRFLEAEEADRLVAACAGPLQTLVLVGLHCGLRLKSEGLTLEWKDIDLGRRTLTVQSAFAKNGRMRTVPLNQPVHEALARLKPTTPTDRVFNFRSITTSFATACRKAKITNCTPHVLRHTFASRLAMAGVDLRTIQELAGWETLSMVMRYAHLSQGHKSEAVERIAGGEFTYRIPHSEKSILTVVS